MDRRNAHDPLAAYEIGPEFERFHQRNDLFTRAFWDERVRSEDTDAFFASYRVAPDARRGDGFAQKDFALRNASWVLADAIANRGTAEGLREGFQGAIRDDTPVAETQVPVEDPAAEATEMAAVARLLGADLFAVTARDPRWDYATRPDLRDLSDVPMEVPEDLGTVIVMGHEMRLDLTDAYPSALAGAATGREYSHEAGTVMQLAAYIRGLGWRATASMNDSALCIPYAVAAGLGEYGRNQMVITPEFGPRVRFSKVFTDMPLAHDAPRPLGIAAYCEGCTVCADACPPRALPHGPPAFGTHDGSDSPSTIKGVRKWSANCEKCFGYWATLKTDCAICMRVCPFSNEGGPAWDDWQRLATGDEGEDGRARARAMAAEMTRPRLKPKAWWQGARDASAAKTPPRT